MLVAMSEIENNELSERELEILKLVATGASNKEIAQRLTISPNTVKVHMRRVFAKVGAASRTEAALYAVKVGIVQTNRPLDEIAVNEEDGRSNAEGGQSSDQDTLEKEATLPASQTSQKEIISGGRSAFRGPRAILMITFIAVILLMIWFSFDRIRSALSFQGSQPTSSAQQNLPTSPVRWQAKASFSIARSGLAAVVYNNQIYIIGGTTQQGYTSSVERYNPNGNSWEARAPKPVAVTDAYAEMIGGLIYVPGGKTEGNTPTNVLDVYNPTLDTWVQRASLPVALSGYAIASFEGRIFLFGGWDGNTFVNTVYEYDPAQDTWTVRSPMPTRRGYASAAAASGKIYVLGGYDGEKALSVNEVYQPYQDTKNSNPWSEAHSLPKPGYNFGLANVADLLYVAGGKDQQGALLPSWIYQPQSDEWLDWDTPVMNRLAIGARTVYLGGYLYLLGGEIGGVPSSQNMVYQALYSLSVPVIIK